jgi:hypothetical protein
MAIRDQSRNGASRVGATGRRVAPEVCCVMICSSCCVQVDASTRNDPLQDRGETKAPERKKLEVGTEMHGAAEAVL